MKRSKPFAITLDPGSSLANRTGSRRTVRPVYVDRLPPCNHACPAGENLQGCLFHAEAGNYEQAWRVLTRDNPLPARVLFRSPQVAGSPKLAVDRAEVDEGYIRFNVPVRTTFRLSNVGDQPLQILGQPQVELVEGC